MSTLPRHQSPARLDFAAINAVAKRALPDLLSRWLPGGERVGVEFCALNPCRGDRHLGNFKVNLITGKWADFATDAKGGDVISLTAYLHNLRQVEAARKLADMFGMAGGSASRG